MSTEIIQSIFDAFGGLSKCATAVSAFEPTNRSTMHMWLTASKGIPKWRRADILRAAYRNRVVVPVEAIAYLDAKGFVRQPKDYSNWPGHQKTDTSKDAADAMAPKAPILRERVLNLMTVGGTHGLTADECADRLGETILSVRPRLSELRAKGKIKDSGRRRKNESGHSAIVWLPA